MNILAIDYGLKRIGLALGNTQLKTVVPLNLFFHKSYKKDLKHLKEVIQEYDIKKIVIGYPLNMDGTSSEMSKIVVNFSKKIRDQLNIKVELADERLTTFEAQEELMQILPDNKKRKQYVDSMSAVIILREYMEEKE